MQNILSGVYKIINISNNKIYIGSSINIKNRIKRHLNDLDKNKHYNIYLQNAWNKYGKEKFLFEILEEVVEKNMLADREQYYIDKYNASDLNYGYNLCPNAYISIGYKHTEETRIRMRVDRKINSQKYARLGENHWNWGNKLSENAYNHFRNNHPDYSGEKSPKAKLTNDNVIELRKLYATKKYTLTDLSLKYNIHKRTVSKIIRRERWKNL